MSQRQDPSETAADRAALRAIEDMPDYQPSNQAHSTPMLQQMEASLRMSEEAQEQARLGYERAQRAYAQARLVRVETAQNFHNLMRAAKTQVLAQYGEDSYAVKAIGWVRKSERRRPGRRRAAAE